MKTRINAGRSVTLLLVASSVLAACSNNVPKITDEEIIAFLGSQPVFGSKSASPTISKEIADCSELISGSKDDVVKDMPAQFLGSIKTACRERFSSLLKDPTKKNFGLTLSSFENKAFAARLVALKNSIDAANDKAREEAQTKEKADSRRKTEAELAKITNDYTEFSSGLDQQLSKANALCDTLKEKMAEIKTLRNAKRKFDNWSYYTPSQICTQDRQAEIKEKAQEILKTLQETKIQDSFLGATFSKPYFGYADPADIQDQMKRLNSDIAKITGDLTDLKK